MTLCVLLYPSQKRARIEPIESVINLRKIFCSFQLLSSLSVNCGKSNLQTQTSDVLYLHLHFYIFSLGQFCVSSLWVLIHTGTQNCEYSKFGRTFNIFETILSIISNFGQLKFVVFKFVGTQNMWVLKSLDNEISNFVGTQNWWQL